MGNDLADAIRSELRAALLRQYGNLEVAASELGMPYKSLYRALTPVGKDRTARVTLDFVLDVTSNLERVAGIDLAEIYRRASLTANVGPRPDDVESVDLGRQDDYDRVARAREDDRGEEPDDLYA